MNPLTTLWYSQMMSRIALTFAGAVSGCLLGIIAPIAFCYVATLTMDDANGIGTPFAILMIITAPLGLLLGAYAGGYRARTGSWEGLFNASTPNADTHDTLHDQFLMVDSQLSELPEDAVQVARANYLRDLLASYENTKPNYGLFLAWLLPCLLAPILLVVPIKMAWDHLHRRKTIREHVRNVMNTWSVNDSSNPI